MIARLARRCWLCSAGVAPNSPATALNFGDALLVIVAAAISMYSIRRTYDTLHRFDPAPCP